MFDKIEKEDILPTAGDRLQKDSECRQLVKSLVSHGFDEGQKLTVIKLLAMELESNAAMVDITAAVRPYLVDYRLVKKSDDDEPDASAHGIILG